MNKDFWYHLQYYDKKRKQWLQISNRIRTIEEAREYIEKYKNDGEHWQIYKCRVTKTLVN